MWSAHRIQTLVNVAMIILLLFGPGTFAPVKAQEPTPAAAGDPQPELLKDIYTANGSSEPGQFLANGNRVFYVASDPDHGEELWVSDGTSGGTQMVIDIYPGESDSHVSNLTLFRGQVYFSTSDSSNGISRIWYTDGTPSGTDDVVEVSYTQFNWLGSSGAWLYFATSDYRLGRYGGPGNAIEWLLDAGSSMCLSPTDGAVTLGGDLYFAAADASGCELWKFDPDTSQADMVKDIGSGMDGSYPENFTVAGSQLFFTAIDANYGTELWVSDGTEAGTHMVKDITDETESFYPWYDELDRTSTGSWLYFAADDSVHGLELWRTDGTEANTTLVADLAADEASSFPEYLTAIDSGSSQTVLFTASDGMGDASHGLELWAVPVPAAGVMADPVLLEIEPGPVGSMPDAFWGGWDATSFPVIGDKIYLSAYDSEGGIELWESDGTPAGTVRVVDGIPGPDGSAPTELAVWGSRLVYSAIDAQHGRELWTSSTAQGNGQMVADVVTDVETDGSSPSAGIVTNVGGANIRYFTAKDPLHGSELWRSDGTTAGTWMVKDIFPGPETGTYNLDKEHSAVIDGVLYFGGTDNFREYLTVWRTDGTPEGTWKLQNPDPNQRYYGFNYMEAAGNTLFFMAFPKSNPSYTQLWKSDGTPEGTTLVKRLVQVCHCTQSLHILGENVIFSDDNALWRSNGTQAGTQPFYSDYHGVFTSSTEVAVFGNKLYFQGPSVDEYIEEILWMTDGTQAGTSHVQSGDGNAFRKPTLFTQVGGNLYFVAQRYDAGGIRQAVALWKISAGGTTVNYVMDLISAQDQLSSNPHFLAPIRDGKWMFLDEGQLDSIHRFLWYVVDPVAETSVRLCHALACYPLFVFDAVVWQGKVFFNGSPDGWSATIYTTYLLESDSTEEGTLYLTVPGTDTRFNVGGEFLSTPNALYFSANDGMHGAEPWVIRSTTQYLYLPLVRKP